MNATVKNPSYSVVSMVCVLLGLFGLGLMVLRPFLPLQEANSMRLESDEFLRQGSFQQINWMTLGERSLSEARRLGKPIMLVLGTVSTRDARMADNYLFADQDVQSYLDRNFISVRVDLDAHPYWGNAFKPVSRVRTALSPTFQVWYLDGQGQAFDFFGRLSFVPLNDPVRFLDELARARESYERHLQNQTTNLQEDDVRFFDETNSGQPDLKAFADRLRGEIHPLWGGFPIGQTQSTRPLAILMILLGGDTEAAKLAVEPMLKSGIVDWLDGGFFRRARNLNWTGIEFDKLAVQNAEAMRILAAYGSLTDDRFANRIAKNAFEALATEYSKSGLVATARIGDENAVGRSARSSFSAKDVRRFWGSDLLTGEEAIAARTLFQLTVEENPQMNLRVSGPDQFDSKMFETILAKLRKDKASVESTYSRNANAFVNGSVTASMYYVARLWDDQRSLARADERFKALSVFGAGSDVSHYALQRTTDLPYLGDYLAVADACLERFLATGDTVSLKRGGEVLNRAQFLFDGPFGFSPTIDRINDLIPNSNLPQVIDGNSESLYARAIRLTGAYGRLFRGGPEAQLAGKLQQSSIEMITRGAQLTQLGSTMAGYAAASATLVDEAHAVVVGPGAIPLAKRLFRAIPTRLVAPALGPVRPDLQGRSHGIYIINGANVTGPFSYDQALESLTWKYDL